MCPAVHISYMTSDTIALHGVILFFITYCRSIFYQKYMITLWKHLDLCNEDVFGSRFDLHLRRGGRFEHCQSSHTTHHTTYTPHNHAPHTTQHTPNITHHTTQHTTQSQYISSGLSQNHDPWPRLEHTKTPRISGLQSKLVY